MKPVTKKRVFSLFVNCLHVAYLFFYLFFLWQISVGIWILCQLVAGGPI